MLGKSLTAQDSSDITPEGRRRFSQLRHVLVGRLKPPPPQSFGTGVSGVKNPVRHASGQDQSDPHHQQQ